MRQPEPIDEPTEERGWYRSAGLSIVSAFPLDDLAERTAPAGAPDIVIERLSESLADEFAAQTVHVVTVGEVGMPWLEVRRGPSAFLARWPEQLDVVVPDDGSRMLVCERGEIADSLARLLLCQGLSFLLPAHGREGMHASAVEIDGRAVVISGESGRGKSTLATALCQAGGKLLADDVVSIRLTEDGTPVIDPSTTKTWLAQELASSMAGDGSIEDLQRLHKVAVSGVEAARATVPLGAVYLIGYRQGAAVVSEPLAWREAVAAFLGALFNLVVRTPERMKTQFKIATEVAAHVPIHVMQWEPGPASAREAAEMIARAMRAPSGGDDMQDEIEETNVVDNGNGNRPRANGSVQRQQLLEMLRAAGVEDLPDDSYDEPLLRTSQVAALLRSSDRTIRTWADAGKLQYIKTLGGRRMFPVSAVMSVLQAMREHREEA